MNHRASMLTDTEQLWASGLIPKGGQIIDASLVSVPKNRNTRDENKQIKAGKTPEGWDDKAIMKRQKDEDARWAKKHGKSHYGYKNHINIYKAHKLILCYAVTDASVHDSQMFDAVLEDENRGRSIWADSAYRSEAREEPLRERGYKSRIHRNGTCRRKLNQQEQATNHRRAKVRARVENVFGDQRTRRDNILVRTKGKVRAAVKIGLMNLTYTCDGWNSCSGRNPSAAQAERTGSVQKRLGQPNRAQGKRIAGPKSDISAATSGRHDAERA